MQSRISKRWSFAAGCAAVFLLLAWSSSSAAKVFWTETFENHLYPNWTGSCISKANPDGTCTYPQITDSFAHSGTHSGFEHYANMHTQAGTFIDRHHPIINNVWMRWYQYTSNFDYGDGSVIVKNFITSGGNYGIYWENLGSSEIYPNLTTSQNTPCQTESNALDSSCNLRPNMNHIPLKNGQWYCIETHVNGGTPGAADGTVEMFVNGIQTVGYYNIHVRFPTDAQNGFSLVRYYAQNGLGDRYIDDLAVGDTRIGCSETTPAPPTDLKVSQATSHSKSRARSS